MKRFLFYTNKILATFLFFFGLQFNLLAQAPDPPLPIEALLGNKQLYFQMVVKKKFAPESRFGFFTVSTYTASYDNERAENSLTIPVQINYAIGKGFGVMAGTDINSEAGFAPIVGPQHNFASQKFLAVTVVSFFLNEDQDVKLFGLYEYKPPINEKWSLYSRVQFIYNHSLKDGNHNRSYLYLRGGLKRNALILGLGANLDQFGPQKRFKDNYGVFARWEFR
ncbi:MAG: hypothetical protein SFU99_24420 [Saprospiraceae bacterium]|nr:hypothetical protein [Saprospiraceae bacterium]